jgi:hypothetical protein
MQLLDFDSCVERYCEQPITIEYIHKGKIRHYTPDVLVYYHENSDISAKNRSPLLGEVKYRADLKQYWTELKPKFIAASRYAAEQGWQFKLITEREIRTDYLTNVRFLRHYTGPHVQITQMDQELLISLLRAIRFTTGEELLLMATSVHAKRAELLYTLWHLIAMGLVHCDLTTVLSLQSGIWIP